MVSPKYVLKFLYLFTFILLSSQSFSETITFKGLVLSDFWIKKVIVNNNINVVFKSRWRVAAAIIIARLITQALGIIGL